MASYFYILWQREWDWGKTLSALLYHQATIAHLTAVIVMQVANGFVCRSSRACVFSLGLLINRLGEVDGRQCIRAPPRGSSNRSWPSDPRLPLCRAGSRFMAGIVSRLGCAGSPHCSARRRSAA
jgi:hypothetical protein